jgi:hypothetical protein
MLDRNLAGLRLSLLPLMCLALAGCPDDTTVTDTGIDTGSAMSDAGTDGGSSGTDTGGAEDGGGTDGGSSGTDGGTGMDAGMSAPDTGVTVTWDVCREAVVFGIDGEACSFTGSCVECTLVASPRQAICVSGQLRTAAAGAGACAGGTDAGPVTFPDAGRRDAGGVDAGGVCPPYMVAPPSGPGCPQSAVDCIAGGGDVGACVSASPACLMCAQQDLQSCYTANGCDDEAGNLVCCFEANCPDGSCASTTCATQANAWTACASDTPCSLGDICFPSAPTCPPAAWRPPTEVGCTSATLTCLTAATTSPQAQACIDADTASTPAGESCGRCINDDILSCATDGGGCDDELGLVQCCFTSACPAGDAACVNGSIAAGGACESRWDTFIMCVGDSSCGISTACFP